MSKEVSQCHSSDDSLHSSDDERNVSLLTITLIVLYIVALSEDEKKVWSSPLRIETDVLMIFCPRSFFSLSLPATDEEEERKIVKNQLRSLLSSNLK